MRISFLGKTLIIGETDKHGKQVKLGIIDNKKGKGKGIYLEEDPIFER